MRPTFHCFGSAESVVMAGFLSLSWNLRLLDHGPPLVDVGFEPRFDCLRRTRLGFNTKREQALFGLGVAESILQGGIQRLDDLGRRAGARKQRVPRNDVIFGN